jgi:CRP-like cAMP-binding protein
VEHSTVQGEFMGDALTILSNPPAITKFDMAEMVKGKGTTSSSLTPTPRTQDASAKRMRRLSSAATHLRFSRTLIDDGLGAMKDSPLFCDLSMPQLNEIALTGQQRAFSHDQPIFAEGDPLRWVSIVTSGYGKKIRHSAAGKPMLVHLCGPGDVLDGLGSTPRSTHSLEARALRECRILMWDVKRFESLSNQFPVLRRNSMQLLLGRLRMVEARLHELATERVPQRLARVLLRLILQARGSARFPMDLTCEDLAQMAGTTQFTVSRLLCDWAAQRIIQPERTALLVENLPGLLAIAMQVESQT